jgi:hypothetical protein
MPVSVYVPVHNLSHHKHSQKLQDVTRTSKLRSQSNLVNFLTAASKIGPHTLVETVKYFLAQKQKGARIFKTLVLVEVFWLALYNLVFLSCFYNFGL